MVEIPGPDMLDVNLNPPVLLPLMALFASVPLIPGALAWTAVSLGAAVACLLAVRSEAAVTDGKLAWALSCGALLDSIQLLQIYVLLLVLGTVMWCALRRDRPWLMAAALGVLIAIKPNFALGLPVLLLAGAVRPAFAAGAVAGGLSLAGLVLAGPEVTLQWLAAVRVDEHGVFPTTVSVFSYFQRLGVPLAGAAVSVALAAGCMAWARLTRLGLEAALVAGLSVSMISAPLCWFHYTLVLVPFVMAARWDRILGAGALLLWLPTAIPLLGLRADPLLQASLGLIYPAGLLLLVIGLANMAPRTTRMLAPQ